MKFFSKWFSKKSPLSLSQIQTFLDDPVRLDSHLKASFEKIGNEKVRSLFPKSIPIYWEILETEIVFSGFGRFLKPSSIRFSDVISENTKEAIVELLSLKAIQPRKEVFEKFLFLPEVTESIADGLESILQEFNQKINPLSGVFKGVGLDKQIRNFLMPILPNIQKNLAENFSSVLTSYDGKKVVRTFLNAAMEIGIEDFIFPDEKDLEKIRSAVKTLVLTLQKDPIFRKQVQEFWDFAYEEFYRQNESKTIKSLTGLDEKSWGEFVSKLSSETSREIMALEERSGIVSSEIQRLYQNILN